MNKIYSILILCSCIYSLNAQSILLEKQEGYNYKKQRPSILKDLGIKDPDFNTIDLALRIYYYKSEHKTLYLGKSGPNAKLFILERYKDGSWKGKVCFFDRFNTKNCRDNNIKWERVKLKKSWPKTWERIIENQYLNIPNEPDALITYKDKVLITVGNSDQYAVETLTKKTKRFMCYSGIYQKQQEYNEANISCPDLDKYVEFISLLKKEIPLEY